MELNLKNLKKQFNSLGIFYTSQEMAQRLKDVVDEYKKDYKTIYDPTVGQGNLLSVFPQDLEFYGQDINPNEVAKAKEILGDNFHGAVGNTLTNPAFTDMKFDVIVANPPFSIKWEQMPDDERFNIAPALAPASKADYAFLLHILHCLKDDGVAVVINFPGILYRKNAEGKIRQWFVENNFIDRVIKIPAKTFVDTGIETCALVLIKNKKNTDIIFEDWELKEKKVIDFESIKDNNFNLSVNHFIEKEVEKEEIDINLINHECINSTINKLKNEYQLYKLIDKVEEVTNWATYFKNEVIDAIKEFD